MVAAGGILHSEDALSSQIMLMKTIWNVFMKFVGGGEGEVGETILNALDINRLSWELHHPEPHDTMVLLMWFYIKTGIN